MLATSNHFRRTIQGFLLTPDDELAKKIMSLWDSEEVHWTRFDRGGGALEYLFTEPPDLLIVDNNMPDMPGSNLVTLVKSENVYRQLPVILCLRSDELDEFGNWNGVEADDFLLLPLVNETAKARISLTLARASRSLDANPLSKLPGNTTIIQHIQDLIESQTDFALAYADLDHFKSFNDKYGFSRGDEALLMTARIIVNTIRQFPTPLSFVGHVGGDDFVYLLEPPQVEEACQQIVERFDAIVPNFYDQSDQEQGFIRSTDRQGQIQEFPFMAISLAVVLNIDGRLQHFGEVSHIASQLKKKAKEDPKSSYVIDRRQYDESN